MANIKIPKDLFEKEIGKLDETMQNKIAMFGTPLESYNDEEMELEIFPNRPDLLSYQGFKRGFMAFIGKKKGLREYKIKKPEKNYQVKVDSSVKNVRPYTVCAIVKNLQLNDQKIKEIIEIQEKLHITVGRKRKKLAIGIYPLEKIKLPITYKALEPDKIKFQPLESPREMSGLQILQRHPAGQDYAHLLAGKTKFPVFLDANNKVLSMPPIINSHETGKVTEKAKEVFIECSGFDQNIIEKCLNILITSFAEMGGQIYQMKIQDSKSKITPNLKPETNSISLENANKLLGLNLTEKQLKENLEKMGHSYSKGKVESPAWRTDILHEVDLIEDIAIAYGYDNFTPIIPNVSTIGKESSKQIIKSKIAKILAGLNMLEISNYHLTNKKDQFTKMGFNEKQEKGFIELEESKTEYNIMRKNLTHYLLKIISENIDSEYPQRIFEIGKVFNKENNIRESEKLSAAVVPGNFTELKQILIYLFEMMNVKINFKEPESKAIPNWFIDGRIAEIKIDDQLIGHIGEIHPRILNNWKIKMPVALFELDLEKVFEKLT